jgi:hypothetical protein
MENKTLPGFGERLKFFRINILKMKRKDFCERFGFPLITVQSWEDNRINISRRNIEKLEEKLSGENIAFNAEWLFLGQGEHWTILKENANADIERPQGSAGIRSYQINSFSFEPLWKKNTELTLEPVLLTDINCPSFVALEDAQHRMHFGIIHLTQNQQHILEAYQGTFYKRVVEDTDQLFLLQRIVFNR